MKKRTARMLGFCLVVAMSLAQSQLAAAADAAFREGRHYSRLTPAVPTSTPAGTIEVTEVFSYGCIACFQTLPTMQKLKKALGTRAKLAYVPAGFMAAEAWPMFQRAYLTAQALGLADQNHDAVFDAIWRTHEIPLLDPSGGRIRKPLPTIDDAAKFYARRSGVKAEDFVTASKSFAVDTKVAQAERLVRAYRADSTPTFIVNGKWKIENGALQTRDDAIPVILFLVEKEAAAAPR